MGTLKVVILTIYIYNEFKMSEFVTKINLERNKDYIYFIDKDGDLSRAQIVINGRIHSKNKSEKIKNLGLIKEKGFQYLIDKEGNITKSKMTKRAC